MLGQKLTCTHTNAHKCTHTHIHVHTSHQVCTNGMIYKHVIANLSSGLLVPGENWKGTYERREKGNAIAALTALG